MEDNSYLKKKLSSTLPYSVNSLYFLYKYDPSTSTTTFAFPSVVTCRILQNEGRSVHDSCIDVHEYRRLIASTTGLFATYLAIKAAFLKYAGTITPLHINHHFSAGIVCFSRGSCRFAPGISAGVRTMLGMLEVAIITSAIMIVLDSVSRKSLEIFLLFKVAVCSVHVKICEILLNVI